MTVDHPDKASCSCELLPLATTNLEQTYENLTADTAKGGTRITWSTETKDKLIRFCARKGLSHGALDARLLFALMSHLGWDTDDDALYEALLEKVLHCIRGNVNATMLKPALIIMKAPGKCSAATVQWATYVRDWAAQEDIIHNHDPPARRVIEYFPPITRAYVSYQTCGAQVLALRRTALGRSSSPVPKATTRDASGNLTEKVRLESDLAAAQSALAKQQLDFSHAQEAAQQAAKKHDAWMETFLSQLAAGLNQDKSSLRHLADTPGGLGQRLVKWFSNACAHALNSQQETDRLQSELIATRNELAAVNAKVSNMSARIQYTNTNKFPPQPLQDPSAFDYRNWQQPGKGMPSDFFYTNGQAFDANQQAFQTNSQAPNDVTQQGHRYDYKGPVNIASPPPVVNPGLYGLPGAFDRPKNAASTVRPEIGDQPGYAAGLAGPTGYEGYNTGAPNSGINDSTGPGRAGPDFSRFFQDLEGGDSPAKLPRSI